MSPQEFNVQIDVSGLAIAHLYKPGSPDGLWEIVVLENTGAPDHGGDHQFNVSSRTDANENFKEFALPQYRNKDRSLVITPEANRTPASEHRPSTRDPFSLESLGDFAEFEPTGVRFHRSTDVETTKVKVHGGLGFVSDYSQSIYSVNGGPSRTLGKGLMLGMKCDPGSHVQIQAQNGIDTTETNLQVPRDGILKISLDNDCDNLGESDFPFYYNDGRELRGIVHPRNMADLRPLTILKNGRVACNVMLATKLEGHDSLLEAIGSN